MVGEQPWPRRTEGARSFQDRAPAILIVEDEFQIRHCDLCLPAGVGFTVLTRATADEAVAMLEQGTDNIDLIFTDIRMPGTMDGLRLARWVYQYRPGLPVVLTTGDVAIVKAGNTFGAARTIFAKPYDMDSLWQKSAKCLDGTSWVCANRWVETRDDAIETDYPIVPVRKSCFRHPRNVPHLPSTN